MNEPPWEPPDPTRLPPPKAPWQSPIVRWWRARPAWQMVTLIIVGVIVAGVVLRLATDGTLGP